MDEQPLADDTLNAGAVVRVGDTVRRPRHRGADTVEALLVHLEAVGFDGAPRFLGHDDGGRQVLSYVEGTVESAPAWQHDDDENARRLGAIAGRLRELHRATDGFVPPRGAETRRPLPLPGRTWTHGDVGYGNVVYAGRRIVALIDWEFAAPADPLCDPAALLAHGIRGPRPDVHEADDVERRAAAAAAAHAAIADAYGCDEAERLALVDAAAVVLDDSAAFWAEQGLDAGVVARTTWRADWFRRNGATFARR